MFEIVVQDSGGKETGRYSCPGGSCTAGRSSKNMVILNGWRIASSHARFDQDGTGVFVTDISGGGGLQVNGRSVANYGPLTGSDVVSLSSYRLRVVVDAPHIQQPPPVQEEISEDNPAAAIESRRMTTEDAGDDRKGTYGVRTRTAGEAVDVGERFRFHTLVHRKLMQAMDLRRTDVESMDVVQLTTTVRGLIGEIIAELDKELPPGLDRLRLGKEVLDEAVGLGPLEDFLADEEVTEIMVNRYNDIYIERHGRLEQSPVTFSSDDAVRSVIERIVSPLGRRIDESSPMVDGRLPDGSRVNAVIPPLAIKGPCLTIRKFSRKQLTTDDLMAFSAMDTKMVSFLDTAVHNRKNIIISGGTGSGKTTFLNVLSNFIPHNERIITVEDSAELRLGQPHVVSLEGRPANMEGAGEVSIRDLVRNCLRMRPDRIVVGECRGGEALDMLQAMNTGHDGSLTTVHANSPRDLISRLEVMVMMAGMDLPERAIREQIVSAVNVIVQLSRFSDGSRKVTHISEITGLEGEIVQMQEIFSYNQHGLDGDGKVVGEFVATGRVPEFYEGLKQQGLQVDMSIFTNP
ncbi:MAG: signal peptide protein [Desulfobulbaceae bacterium BRH_c16a]|nr:MAG: signal peptide protein [Desulfobulbaceae bacterium BRH_c16a]